VWVLSLNPKPYRALRRVGCLCAWNAQTTNSCDAHLHHAPKPHRVTSVVGGQSIEEQGSKLRRG
jgi:hypothetical protein